MYIGSLRPSRCEACLFVIQIPLFVYLQQVTNFKRWVINIYWLTAQHCRHAANIPHCLAIFLEFIRVNKNDPTPFLEITNPARVNNRAGSSRVMSWLSRRCRGIPCLSILLNLPSIVIYALYKARDYITHRFSEHHSMRNSRAHPSNDKFAITHQFNCFAIINWAVSKTRSYCQMDRFIVPSDFDLTNEKQKE